MLVGLSLKRLGFGVELNFESNGRLGCKFVIVSRHKYGGRIFVLVELVSFPTL
jgi:hypothetical protein